MNLDRNNLAAIAQNGDSLLRLGAADREHKADRFMVDLIEGQQYILATRAGVLKLFAAYDGEADRWRLADKNGQLVFTMDDSFKLTPQRPIADPASFTIHDLHEWGERA